MPSLSALPLTLALLTLASPSWAMYKVVGPDGKVTYTDRPPTDRASQAIKANGAVSDTGSLPFELRQVTLKFPVVLYATKDCSVCDQGRTLLKQRGIPFQEKSVDSNDDIQAFKRQEGTDQLPVLRVGSQQLKGFASQSWQSYLDAAGYPKESVLPRTYQWPVPTPLVQAAPVAPSGTAATRGAGTTAPPATTQPAPASPTAPGFRF